MGGADNENRGFGRSSWRVFYKHIGRGVIYTLPGVWRNPAREHAESVCCLPCHTVCFLAKLFSLTRIGHYAHIQCMHFGNNAVQCLYHMSPLARLFGCFAWPPFDSRAGYATDTFGDEPLQISLGL